MLTYKRKAIKCPVCKKELDSHSPVGGGPPGPQKGDISICACCGMLLEYDTNESFIAMRPETLVEVKKDPVTWKNIVRAQKFINAYEGPKK